MHVVDSQCTDRRALRAEYCIVGIPQNTAIQLEIYLFGVLEHSDDVTLMHPLTTFHKRSALNRDPFAISLSIWPPME